MLAGGNAVSATGAFIRVDNDMSSGFIGNDS